MPRPKPRRETAAARRTRLQAAYCGVCLKPIRECRCPSRVQRWVTAADLLRGAHADGEHQGDTRDLDCTLCNPRRHRKWPSPPLSG